MKNTSNNAGSRGRTRQVVLIAVIVVIGVLLSTLILAGTVSENSASDQDEHTQAAEQTDGKQGEEEAGHAHESGATPTDKDQHESEVTFTEAQIQAAGISMAVAGPARIQGATKLPGEIVFNADRTAQLVPRLAGVVQTVKANLGQEVKQGEVLAIIASPELSERRSTLSAAQKRLTLARTTYERERLLWKEKISAEQDYLQARQQQQEAQIAVANALEQLQALGTDAGKPGSFNRLEVRAPFDGMIVEKDIALGETVSADASIFKISDLSTVWADIIVPAEKLGAVRVGSKAIVQATAFDSQAEGVVSYVGSLLGQQSRAATARVSLSNPSGSWRPGLFVNVQVVSGESDVPVAVEPEAVHTVEQESVVFVRHDNEFVAQIVKIGRRDAKAVEVLEGLKAGARYAVKNSFVIKSELGKGSASHSH
ncbi:efflux RND transporter periplasmic adaptor subunit [Paenalcaligenes niemegkensis]|uniref:efflux RND transporter periplasmic adaptor subunit n=1 Tax=Paenalcaligenes niemegkensis TaxID=2895469 RepID=UPI001EE978DA|nr:MULTISPECIES: efflux RND transporter periplasmic adaptor subunit [Alcaligenaceae]MCQ9617329.1 efflux RND transporter periplasmic adaptor subunit [Paenalcaligenes niemegkensis]